MKKNILGSFFAILTFASTYSQNLTEPKGGGVLDIITIIPADGYSDMVFEGQISGYGTVYVAFKVASINSSKNSGTLDGQGRTILENGTLISTPLKGTWKRTGSMVKFYFTDAINNGAMNFVMWDVDLLEKKADVRYFELHSAEN
tara:strand:+ start:68 stop:502 length:435 start_codon:yes stop_codon:yes gene_type:complete